MRCRYFGTDGIRGKVGQFPMVPEFIFKLGWATGRVLSRYGLGNVIIGKDTRISGHMLESALGAGLSSAGITFMSIGPMPTPAVAYFTRTFHVGGIVISASHNPFYDNGVKFFSIKGSKLSVEVEKAIEIELENKSVLHCVGPMEFGKFNQILDAPARYIEFCKGTFPSYLNLKNLKIILDCAHGSAYHIAPHMLCELGATVTCIGCQPNGININEKCGTTDICQLQSLVLKERANLGIAYDGDADRVIMVDHLGNKVDGDQMLYIIARDRKKNSQLLGGVVGTYMSNIGLELALKTLDIPFVRTQIGDRYVLSMMKKKGWYVGGENSGHIVLLDKTTTGDGIIACLEVLFIMVNTQMSLYDLCKDIYLFPQVLLNVPSLCSKNFLEIDFIKNTINEIKGELGKHGRVLLRASGTEPCVRIMVEGECYHQITYVADKIVNMLKIFE